MSKKPRKEPSPGAAPPRKSRAQVIEEIIERAMRPYLGVLPPEGLRIMRDTLEDALTTHPEALAALDELEEKPPADPSGTRPRGAGGEGGGDGGAA